jgi:hypothetical protein
LDVPPRIHMQRTPAPGLSAPGPSDIFEAHLLQRVCRACRRCRGRVRRRQPLALCRSSLAFARLGGGEHFGSLGARTTQTPSSSATITSPGLTSAPAQTTGTLTEPSVVLDRALRVDRLRPDREAHLGQVAHVAHAGVDDQAAAAARHAPTWRADRRNSRPRKGLVGASTRMSPGCSCSIATCTIQLSPGGAEIVTAVPAMRAPA